MDVIIEIRVEPIEDKNKLLLTKNTNVIYKNKNNPKKYICNEYRILNNFKCLLF